MSSVESTVLGNLLKKAIELDCPPSAPRTPWELISEVVEGTALEPHTNPQRPQSVMFNSYVWDYAHKVTDEEWLEAHAVIKERIDSLYERKLIRFRPW